MYPRVMAIMPKRMSGLKVIGDIVGEARPGGGTVPEDRRHRATMGSSDDQISRPARPLGMGPWRRPPRGGEVPTGTVDGRGK